MFEQNPTKWTPDFFDRMRKTGDAYADKVIQDIFAGSDVHTINQILVSLTDNDQPVPEDLPPEVIEYFENTAKLPSWSDFDLIRQGEDLFTDFSLIAFSVLGCASLPECYSGAIGAKVLAITGQLEDHVNRRIIETFFMVVDIMGEGGLGSGGKGIRASQKVRLMHAAIRHLILSQDMPSPNQAKATSFAETLCNLSWDLEKDGYPINQETMGMTYLTFSYIIIRSLKRLGVTIEKDRENAYFHCWNLVGHILGVDETFFVTNMADAEKLWGLVHARLRQASPEGVHLTRVLMGYIGDQIKSGSFLGRFLPYRHVPKWLTRELVGKETATLLGIKWNLFDKIGMWFTTVGMHLIAILEKDIYADLPFGHRLAEWVFRKLAAAEHERIGNRPEFIIPDHLKRRLNLT